MRTVAVVGGTGPQGSGLAFRFAMAGHDIVLGSRSEARAVQAAASLTRKGVSGAVRGATNAKACESADVVLLAVPWRGQDDLIGELAPHLSGRVVVSCVNPLGFDARGPYGLDLGQNSAAERVQEMLPDAAVVGAFHHLSAVSLATDATLAHEDILVCGDDADAKATVIELAKAVTGKPGIDAGALRLARQLEPLTAVLISINKKYKVRSGIAVAGLAH
ncbi:NADPH-dependent F420 reductase [Kribbella sp. NPDC050124]|uniref:NADPH-dependent F420 reductase n=1 Tax=Kribbella sp. NPDC050124 TaxID=3364114 RepID=UPI0037AE9205